MAAAPAYKIYATTGEYLAAVKYGEDAACLVGMRGNGATIRYGHDLVLWIEGSEGWPAGESYDRTADILVTRFRAIQEYIRTEVLANRAPSKRQAAAYARVTCPSDAADKEVEREQGA